jgi:K+ transporter
LLLYIAVVILVPGFQTTDNFAAAYGIAVTGDMVITSVLATFVAAKSWGWGRSIAFFVVFLSLELIFLFANILKIPHGGWFPLVAGAMIFLVMNNLEAWRAVVDRAYQQRGNRTGQLYRCPAGVDIGARTRYHGIHDLEKRPCAEFDAAQSDAQQGAA